MTLYGSEKPKFLLPERLTVWQPGGDTALVAATEKLVDLSNLIKDFGPTLNTFLIYNGDGTAYVDVKIDGKFLMRVAKGQTVGIDWEWRMKFSTMSLTASANIATDIFVLSVGNTGPEVI